MSGELPIADSDVTLYGRVTQCIPDPCVPVNRAILTARTDQYGFFSMDLSRAVVEVRNVVGMRVQVDKERPFPNSLYLVASGERVNTRPNPAIKLMLAMGEAPRSGRVTINEFTTVASELSLTGAMGAQNPEELGVASEVAMARALVDPETGHPQAIFDRGLNNPALINSLADIIAACVRSEGPAAPSCSRLFAAAPDTGLETQAHGSPILPTDTMAAVRNVLFYRTRNTRRLFDLLPHSPPYRPVLTSPPNAWILSVNFATPELSEPTEIAADLDRDAVWIANTGGNSVVELSTAPGNLGSPLLPGGGFATPNPFSLRIAPLYLAELRGGPGSPIWPTSVWVANRSRKTLTVLLPGVDGVSSREIGHDLDVPSGVARFPNNEILHQVDGMWIPYEVLAIVSSGSNSVSFFLLTDQTVGHPSAISASTGPAPSTTAPTESQAYAS